jgi:hypothetical protein
VIDRSVSIAVQDQVRRRVGVDTVTWAGRTRELRVVIHPVESKQRRSPWWRRIWISSAFKVDRSTAVEVDQEGAADDRFCSRVGPH